ncbi:MAG: cobalt ABC transporter ATP-binding protein [Candidatus Binatia bacterium]|nr:MAG: cobalt ABC transporter ATP-binding protein [Candidatus Binatia bacterium]
MTNPSVCAACLRGVSFTYEGSLSPALSGLTLDVRRGEMLVVMGPSRAGKSTLAKLLNRTVPSFQHGTLEGEVWLLGERCVDQTVADFAGRIGLVAQDFEAQLFSTSVDCEVAFALEQFGIAPPEMRERVRRALAAVGLQGFETRDPATLSGGEKQRLAIGAMLALEPELFVLDEPTTDLDPVGKEEVLAVVAALRQQGRTLVVVEHETLAAEMADRVVLLDRGRIVAQGPPREVLREAELLLRCAVRPPDLACLAWRLGWSEVPRDVAHAQEMLGLQRPCADAAGEPEPNTCAGHAPLLAAKNVSLQYEDSSRPALDDVSVEICSGEFVALLGQNGSGKTTLAKCFNGLLRPSGGQVLWKGRPILGIPLSQRAAAVGYVFQNPDHQIFCDRVYDEVAFGPKNLGLSPEEIRARVDEALAAVGLQERVEDDPFWLTKGERQRLAVASLLALRPELLVLDEPTTGLDYQEQRQMMELVRRLHEGGMTVVMITHTAWLVAEYAQRVVLLSAGRVLFDGPTPELFARADLLVAARFRVPPIVALGQRCGLAVRSVDEFVHCVKRTSSGG